MKILFDFLKSKGLFERYESNVNNAIKNHMPGITKKEVYSRIGTRNPVSWVMCSFDFEETPEGVGFWNLVTKDFDLYYLKQLRKEKEESTFCTEAGNFMKYQKDVIKESQGGKAIVMCVVERIDKDDLQVTSSIQGQGNTIMNAIDALCDDEDFFRMLMTVLQRRAIQGFKL